MKNLFLLVLSFSTFVSCRKESSTTVIQGIVTEYGTGEPSRNSGVILLQSSPGAGFGLSKRPVDSIPVNADGTFYYKFEWQGGGYSLFPVGYDSLYLNRPENEFVNIFKGRVNTVHLVNEPIGFLTVHIKNVSPNDDSDWIDIGISGNWINSQTYYGSNVDVVVKDSHGRFVFPIAGNRYTHFRIWTYHHGDTIKRYDSTYLPAFDTLIYTINY